MKENEKTSVPSEQELQLINTYTRRTLTADEVYVFSVVLCDNEIDRDFECFADEALDGLCGLFVGKSGILDHNPKSENQTARIFSCFVEEVKGKLTKNSKQYKRLVARAYLPQSEKNSELILMLDSGIKKEVSVGCSMGRCTCSICGGDMKHGECDHIKGITYGGKLCYGELSDPKDAYEWSFVAVPAQREAGVIKCFKKGKENVLVDSVVQKLCSAGEEVRLSCGEARKIFDMINELKVKAQNGEAYFNEMKSEVIRLGGIVQPELSSETLRSVAERMSLDELKDFKKAYESKAAQLMPQTPQLFKEDGEKTFEKKNNAYCGI